MNATGSRLIVKKLQANAVTASGIVLRNPNEQPRAQAISCGPRVTQEIQPGAELIVDWSRIGRFEYLEQEYFILDESAVLCIVE